MIPRHSRGSGSELRLVRREYSHPDSRQLINQLQELYTRIYGEPDRSPIDDAEFDPPRGALVVGYVADEPVAVGAWRRTGNARAELKRMFVHDQHQGRGYSRAVLCWLENSARDHDVTFMILETNENHPTAIALYRSAGYVDIPNYGHYANNIKTVSLGREI